MGSLPKNDDLRLVFQGAALQHIPKGEVLHSSDQPDRLFFIRSGFVKRYFISHNGDLGVQEVYGSEDIFPLTVIFRSLFDQEIYQGPEVYYYRTMTDVRLFITDVTSLLEKVEMCPTMYRTLLHSAGMRFHSNIQFLENLRLHGAYCKVAHQLAYFGNRFGKKTLKGIRIRLPLTHQDIADIIGTTRETVTASIIKLRKKNIIKTDRHILILDFDRLLRVAYS